MKNEERGTKNEEGFGFRVPGSGKDNAPSTSLPPASHCEAPARRYVQATKQSRDREGNGRGGLSPFLMHGEAGLSAPASARASLGCPPLIKKGDCPWHSTTSGTVIPFGALPPWMTLATPVQDCIRGFFAGCKPERLTPEHADSILNRSNAKRVRSDRAFELIKRVDSPPRPSLLGPGIASLPAHTAVPAPRNDTLGQ
jgi:hypothetical protein